MTSAIGQRTDLTWSQIVARKAKPAVWGLRGIVDAEVFELVNTLAKSRDGSDKASAASQPARDWLACVGDVPWNVSNAALTISLARFLPAVVRSLDPATAERLVERLLQLAQDGDGVSSDESCALVTQWLQVELPWCLALWWGDEGQARELARKAITRMEHQFEQLLDGEGQLRAEDLGWLRPIWASWTASLAIAKSIRERGQLHKVAVPDSLLQQYEWIVRQAVRLTRRDGSSAFGFDESTLTEFVDMAKASLRVKEDKDDGRVVRSWSDRKAVKNQDFAFAGDHSEWAEYAICRCSWNYDSPMCAVRYDHGCCRLELSVGGRVLLSGAWVPEVEADGRTLNVVGEWESVCWEADEDVDYLELEIDLDGGWRIQRQIVLTRATGLLLLADSVLGTEPVQIKYRSQLPRAEGVQLTAEPDTTEVHLEQDRRLATLLPLAVGEWTSAARGLGVDPNSGLWQQAGLGRNLYCPMLVVLDPRRLKKKFTWRQLTVAEQLTLLPADVAVAYRFQIGKRQWVVYRSLDEVGNRTFLGQNLVSEFLFAEFLSDGEIETLIEIE